MLSITKVKQKKTQIYKYITNLCFYFTCLSFRQNARNLVKRMVNFVGHSHAMTKAVKGPLRTGKLFKFI